ncbi:flagellar filament capping protein FliD [Crateriforma conspicua]|uniref:flagellar filament capping protein FliD n=1 Tax=Crateriforma conspicua TaxID=2527996 RepID=UPI00118B92D4|nr:flagellar filament capping protein FliD [Crateriforma conspicua]QDV65096.1 Flagellar hook-associated protein 2 [Crateriforma conspicua]
MGRIQSSVGLVTGTDILGTVDQLMQISAQPRDRLSAQTESLRQEQSAVNSLMAMVIGVQLAGNGLGSEALYHSKSASSSNKDVLSATAGENVETGDYSVRTLATAATHSVSSRRRFDSAEEALGFEGKLTVAPEGFLDQSASLADLNGGRGVEAGTIRITDRSGASAEIDLSDARTVDDVITAINDADVDVRATTVGGAFRLIDETGQSASNLIVEQLGSDETAADLGLWGVNEASDSITGAALELPDGVQTLRGVALDELAGGAGLDSLTTLDITLSDGSSASVDLSSATSTSEVIDLIDAAGLDLIVGLNDARNGLRIRDVSGGSGNLQIDSADDTASALGLQADTTDDIVVGTNLNRQLVTADTKLEDMNGGAGIGLSGFTIKDSAGVTGAINLKADQISTIGELVDAINDSSADVTASINEAGDGIQVIDNAGGEEALTITDGGSGTAAADLGIAGTATEQTIGGQTVSALVGTQADVIEVTAEDTLTSIAEKINNGRYATAGIRQNDDGSFSLSVRSQTAGESGQLAINTSGFSLDLDTTSIGQDALIGVTDADGSERFYTSTDGVFEIGDAGSTGSVLGSLTALSDLGITNGSLKIQDSTGATGAVNITTEGITSVGALVDRINALDIGVTASIKEDGSGVQIIDNAGGDEDLVIEDVGNGIVASTLGFAGTGETQTIDGVEVLAVTPEESDSSDSSGGLVLTVKELSDEAIKVTVGDNPDAAVNAVKRLVTQYNTLVDEVGKLSYFDSETDEVGLLFGSSEVLRIETGYSRLISGQIRGAGDIQSLGQVGLRLDSEGKLQFDESKFKDTLSEQRESVVDFFTTDDTGLVARMDSLGERLAGDSSSLLLTRTQTLTTQIERNDQRVEYYNARLETEREQLLLQFIGMEEAIAKLQGNISAIESIQPIEIPE